MASSTASPASRSWLFLDALVVFLGAFLLFQIQPVYSKYILPWFGGAPLVWATCLVFFQLALLGGYLYADILISRIPPKMQGFLHAGLLLASLSLLPGLPSDSWKPSGTDVPAWQILSMLTLTIGLPYFLLSSTSPLIQAWIARYRHHIVAYRLFSLSNLASILGLLSYPFLIEPVLGLRVQFNAWSWLYVAYASTTLLLIWFTLIRRAPQSQVIEPSTRDGVDISPHWLDRLQWVAYAACPSVLFLALTNHLTQDVAPVPFLWILPLVIYLLTFVLCFEYPYLIPLRATRWAAVVFVVLISLSFALPLLLSNYVPELILDCLGLFAVGLFCHRELYERRPAASRLTGFYVMVSLGGSIGGVFVGLIAPYVFTGYFEVYIGLALCGALAFLVEYQWKRTSNKGTFEVTPLNTIPLFSAAMSLAVAFAIGSTPAVRADRNFFGAFRVVDELEVGRGRTRILNHGTTKHGLQFLSGKLTCEPTSYFGRQSGVGIVIRVLKDSRPAIKVRIIGLGAGTIGTYARTGDDFVFYEINPLIESVAREQFTFLSACSEGVGVVIGDGRVAMERAHDTGLDLIVIDAFAGDSIPTHLLTAESFDLYKRQLRSGGVIAVNISNRYLDLSPVLKAAGDHIGFTTRIAIDRGVPEIGTFDSQWAILSKDPAIFADPQIERTVRQTPQPEESILWTDDYSNLFRVLR